VTGTPVFSTLPERFNKSFALRKQTSVFEKSAYLLTPARLDTYTGTVNISKAVCKAVYTLVSLHYSLHTLL
jgi:hypothetical protein